MLQAEYPVEIIWETLNSMCSMFYHISLKVNDSALRSAIEPLAEQYPTYDSRWIITQLRREPDRLIINCRQVQRLTRRMGLSGKLKRQMVRKPAAIMAIHATPTWLKIWQLLHPTKYGYKHHASQKLWLFRIQPRGLLQ